MIIVVWKGCWKNCCIPLAIPVGNSHPVVAAPNPIQLNCALTCYLVETSRQDRGGEAAFSAAMLADLGYFNKHQADPYVGNIRSLLNILTAGNHVDSLADMNRHCGACTLRSECTVGQTILEV